MKLSRTLQRTFVGIVADDLTGAADSLVKFRDSGWPSDLLVGDGVPAWGAAVAAVSQSLDTRALGDEAAIQRTRQGVLAGIQHGVNRLYVKVDSTLRGSVAAQVQGALEAWSTVHPGAFAVICPAYVRMRRWVVDGRVLVDGVALDASPLADDPVTPVRSARMDVLIPGARSLRPDGRVDTLIRQLDEWGTPGARIAVDARDAADLANLARAVAALGARVVPVGSADLAAHLAAAWHPEGGRSKALHIPPPMPRSRIVVGVTSLNAVSLEQVDAALNAWKGRAARYRFSAQDLANAGSVTEWRHDVLRHEALSAIVLQPAGVAASGAARQNWARMAEGIAAAVRALAVDDRVTGLVLVGGDGAGEVLKALQVRALRLEGSLMEGVPFGRLLGGVRPGMPVVTKAGGFGGRTTLSEIFEILMPPREGETDESR